MINEISILGKKLSDTTLQMHEAIASTAGLSGMDHKYLYLIVENGPITAGELADKAHLTTGAVTGVIDRLEKRKLVNRVFDQADRRKVRIKANKKVLGELLTPLSDKLRQRITNLLETFNAEERTLIERYLNASITVMQEFTEELYSN
ncbi:MAG: MarR family transcriptional regulator [Sphingobacteriaceae bacterium]|nr:MAG: MarR family transcriptional regulator [Sphingobacteriaceae bacterium]